MSLPTPPGTSHNKDKENRFGGRVVWSQHNQYFYISNTPRTTPLAASKDQPTKSILKKSSPALLTVPEEKQRETTPEPEDPLTNLSYLNTPVSKIVSPTSSLRDLIESYSVLAVRLRVAVNGSTDTDASWPLFQPIRKSQQALVDAITRDLGRALLDPNTAPVDVDMGDVFDEVEEKSLLPSPKSSPKKKMGMSAEQVKYARDLCTTSHAVMKFLGAVFTIPAVFRVFSDDQLHEMLTGVLAIPIAPSLPTPNARKTNALSIWLLQAQRLPAEVLTTAKDRIAYALRRGIEGELGKEGKKGSACDGLKAIHDLSIYQPTTFVPSFTELLPSILTDLLAPTLLLRTQACHALGGFTLGVIAVPQSYLHTRIARIIADFLNTPSTPRKSPSKVGQESAIIRTLRTTLNALEPTHVAHGPVWALSILASFIVLLGPALCEDIKLARIISALLALSMRNKKSSVRGLGCLLWRCVAWAYFRPPSVLFDDDGEDERDEFQRKRDEEQASLEREGFWKVVKSVVDMGAGVSTVAALLGDHDDDNKLRKVFSLIRTMIRKGGQTCSDGMEVAKILVSFNNPDTQWSLNKLLPPSLFSSSPGLLTQDYKTLSTAVKPIFDQCPQFDDVRSLSREDVSQEWVFDELVDIWRSGLGCLEMPEDSTTPSEVVSIWEGLLRGNIAVLLDAGSDDATVNFATRAAVILIDILQDPNLDLTLKAGAIRGTPTTSPTRDSNSTSPQKPVTVSPRSNAALKLSIIREFWAVMRTTIPNNLLNAGGATLLACLIENEEELVWETDAPDDARKEWAYLCAEVLVVCDIEELTKFWSSRARARTLMAFELDVQSLVWNCFVEKWIEDADGTWEGAVVLLSVPFIDSNAWELSNQNFDLLDHFLVYTINKALDYGIDSIAVLDYVAEALSHNSTPGFASSTRVADLLLGHLEIADARQAPSSVFEFINNTLLATYPPEPRNKTTSIWLIRSLTRIVDACPVELARGMFEALQDGISTWISDEYFIFDGLSKSSFNGRDDKPSAAVDSFEDFWKTFCAVVDEPEDGWPEKIQTCLRSLSTLRGGDFAYSKSAGTSTAVSPLACRLLRSPGKQTPCSKSSFESPFSFSAKKTSPFAFGKDTTSPTFGHLGPALFTPKTLDTVSGSPPATSSLAFPTTPTKRSNRPTPSRPHKPSTTPETFQSLVLRTPTSSLPLIPGTYSSPQSLPTVKSERISPTLSPGKCRSTEDKENISPSPLSVPSVVERILANSSPSPSKLSSVLGKRRSLDELQQYTAKRGKTASGGKFTLKRGPENIMTGSDSEDERSVEVALSSDDGIPSSDPPSECAESEEIVSEVKVETPSQGSRKRKRRSVFMDAVEVPSVREIRRRWQERSISIDCSVTSPLNKRLRRVSSLPQMSEPEELPRRSTRKRLRRWDAMIDASSDASIPSSPFKLLEELKVVGSDDSIVLTKAPFPLEGSSELSSDDDPHLGQVTPHHLKSPALRRIYGLDYDPPSDDSTLTSSPSRDIVTRRRQRLLAFSESRHPQVALSN